MTSLEESLETAHNALDDIWKLDEFRYPQKRMENLMEVIGEYYIIIFFMLISNWVFFFTESSTLLYTGNAITQFIRSKIKDIDLWESPFNAVEENLSQVIIF